MSGKDCAPFWAQRRRRLRRQNERKPVHRATIARRFSSFLCCLCFASHSAGPSARCGACLLCLEQQPLSLARRGCWRLSLHLGPRTSPRRWYRAIAPDAQFRQALDNVKAVVESAGLTLENVVYVQVYLTDIGSYPEMNRVFGEYFPKTPPARAVLGVYALPYPPVQINAVAVRNLDGTEGSLSCKFV